MTVPPVDNEQQILASVANGDERAFSVIFDYYRPYIYTYVYRMTHSETVAQEVLQDAFLKAWLKRETLPGVNNFAGWLFTVAGRIAIDALRQRSIEKEKQKVFLREADAESGAFTSTEEYILRERYNELIQKAMLTLPGRQLEAFRLIKLEGLSRERAAERMGISQDSVKTNLALALQKIRAYCVANHGIVGVLVFFWGSR